MGDIVMPRLSDTMEEGTILSWLKHDGEQVQRGEELVEIETDKATMTYESDQQGTLQTVAREGDTLPVGELIARVGDAGEAPAEQSAPAAASAGGPGAGESAPAVPAMAASAPGPAPPASAAADGQRVKASPLARRIALETGVDLHALTGSGPGGRIVKADVQERRQATARHAAAPAPARPRPPGPTAGSEDVMTAKGQTTTVALSRTQQTIARRMAESKATIPDFTLQGDVDMEAA